MALVRQLRVLDTRDTGAIAPTSRKNIKVAFATSDLKHVDQHFGSSERIVIFSLDEINVTLVEVAEFGVQRQDGNESKLLEKFVLLEDCAAVYCQAVGGSAVRQLTHLGVQPVKVPEGSSISAVLNELQYELKRGPTGWLARALTARQEKADNRFDAIEAEGWSE